MPKVYDPEQKDDLTPQELREAEQGAHDKVGLSPGEQAQLDQLEASLAAGETAAEPKPKQDQVGKGYSGPQPDSDAKSDKKPGFGRRVTKKQGLILGGALATGLIGGLTLFSSTFATLQFLHISEVLSTQLSTQQDQDDESLIRLYRYIHHLKRGNPERVRLVVMNRAADRGEARLKAVGLTSMYTNIYGFIDGYAIDRAHPEFRNMDNRQLTQYVKATYGIDVVEGSTLSSTPEAKNKMVIKTTSLGHFTKGRKLLKKKLREAGMNRVSSIIMLRLLAVRSGAGFHPMTLKGIDNKILRSFEDLMNKMHKRYLARIKSGTNVVPGVASSSGGDSEEERARSQSASDTRAQAEQVLADGADVDNAMREGNSRPLSTFQNSVQAKLIGGGASAASIPCILRGIASDSGEIRKAQVLYPGIRTGMEYVSLGSQGQTNIDYQGPQLEYYGRRLSGPDNHGRKTTFSDARGWKVLQSTKGPPYEGIPPSDTLSNIGSGTPFDFLNEGGTGATLDVVCSAPVQIGLTVVTFLGGPVSAVAGIAAGIAAGPLLDDAAQWMSGNALNAAAQGAELGNNMTYGMAWAAYEQGLASGGNALEPQETQRLENISTLSIREDFESKSLAYRLFNPKDYRTPVAQLIDKQSTQDIGQNVARAVHGLTHVGSALVENFSRILSLKASAQSAPYNWGLPKVGFTVAEMNDPRYQNPYEVGDRAATLLDSPLGDGFIEKAAKCKSVTLSKDPEGRWNATSVVNSTANLNDVQSAECKDSSFEWTTIRFFIKYTTNANAETCRIGDAQSCADVGFGSGGGAPSQ